MRHKNLEQKFLDNTFAGKGKKEEQRSLKGKKTYVVNTGSVS